MSLLKRIARRLCSQEEESKYREVSERLKKDRNSCHIFPPDWRELNLPFETIKLGQPKRCYANAISYAKNNPGYRLFGGCIMDRSKYNDICSFDERSDKYWGPGSSFSVHAFCISPENKIADPTLPASPDECVYFGKEIPISKFSVDRELEAYLYAEMKVYDDTFIYGPELQNTWDAWKKRKDKM
jgi:hypothetical protein